MRVSAPPVPVVRGFGVVRGQPEDGMCKPWSAGGFQYPLFVRLPPTACSSSQPTANETQLGWETISVEVVTESETLGPGMLKAFLHLTSYMQVGGCVEVKWDYLRV